MTNTPDTGGNLRHVALLILACFFLASTGWLLWLYHLTTLVEPQSVGILTMGIGYPMQALGICAFILYEPKRSGRRVLHTTQASIAASVVCLIPATLAPDLVSTLAFGYLASLLFGYAQGFYLSCLSRYVEGTRRGVVFGASYAVSTVLSWVLSALAGGTLVRGVTGLCVCGLLAVAAVLSVRQMDEAEGVEREKALSGIDGKTIILACVVVTLMSLTKGAGFSFPTTDLQGGVSLELSRVLYGVGLFVAGLASDRDRRYGAICCAAALVMPFLMLALASASAPATIVWALAYLLNGFFSVFRVVLLADLAAARGNHRMAGLGLLFGRVGDAVGTILSVALAATPLALITVTSVLFACTVALFFALFQQCYELPAASEPSERELFERFAARHDLSARERDVLRLLLAEQSNSEIAAALFVSESTIKFHVRNLLKKTGCKNRLELLALYGGVTREG